MKRKCLAIGIILLFVGTGIIPSTGISNGYDDTIPPVTTISLNPPEPDGENDWYVSIVTVTLNATDNESGVKITEYQIDGGAWQTYLQPFYITTEYHHKIMYRSIDNAGNTESSKNVTFKMDRTKPSLFLDYTTEGDYWHGFDIIFTATAVDSMSGMNRVEFYIDGKLYEIINGSGPVYVSTSYPCYYEGIYTVKGFILNPKITDSYVEFYALLVTISVRSKLFSRPPGAYAYDAAGNWRYEEIVEPSPSLPFTIIPGRYLLKGIILPNNYTGHIGRFCIKATFYEEVR